MPTKKKRVNVVMDDWMVDAVEGFKKRKGIDSTSLAATLLIEQGLKSTKQIQKPEPVKRLDEAKLRRHVKALCELLDVTWGDAVEELDQASPTGSAQDESS